MAWLLKILPRLGVSLRRDASENVTNLEAPVRSTF
jgi:hypothetical protein